MSTDGPETNTSDLDLSNEPDPSNNEEVLDGELERLREKYSYERLAELSAVRLGAIQDDDGGYTESEFMHDEFRRLRGRFPDSTDDWSRRRLVPHADDLDLAPLTPEQKQRIADCHQECSRNMDRAPKVAIEDADTGGPLSKLSSWLIEFADTLTPIFYQR